MKQVVSKPRAPLPRWAFMLAGVALLLYFASVESRLGHRPGEAELTILRDSLAALDTLRGEVAQLRESVTSLETASERAGGLGGQVAIGAPNVPIATVIAFAGNKAIPSGWLLCDGSELRREGTYAELFAAIGTTYGAGDGVDTFNVPDYRGLFLRGVDDPDGSSGKPPPGRDPDAAERVHMRSGGRVGDLVGSVQGDATRAPNEPFVTQPDGPHQHVVLWSREGGGGMDETRHAFQSSTNRYGQTTIPRQHDPRQPEVDGAHLHAIDPQSGDRETRPKNASVYWIIKATPD